MKTSLQILFALLVTLGTGCSDTHLINNKEYRDLVELTFAERKQLAKNRKDELFSVFDKKLSVKEEEALKFLYAFMPLSDLADYKGDFFLANADMALRTQAETTWGIDIPEDIFLHYVLPCRVNNENLDSFRIVYYDEILSRVKDKEVRKAALEINHWCHEKVSYQSADSRTSGPMSTILSSRGRCGEESTLTVAALRTAGIPARQVYTPRWAHSDDNHAWVEIWFRGEWYYMGACEPEPVLDRGWFTEPARRAMLIDTKSFGAYWGQENYITRQKNYTEVNNLSKYAKTKRIYVKVLDANGLPVSKAQVEYQLYNYAEFYPIAVVPTDSKGLSKLETGFGDLLIWADKDDAFDFKKISVGETDTLMLKLNRKPEGNSTMDLDLNVPPVLPPLAGPSADEVKKNSARVAEENLIRQKYIDSWMSTEDAKNLGIKLKVDTSQVIRAIKRSMGNYKEISSFLSETADSLRNLALSMLEILPDKDLRDTKSSVLSDHIKNAIRPEILKGEKGSGLFLNYVINPRIANENLVAWRSYFLKSIDAKFVPMVKKDPALIVKYVNDNIDVATDENYYKTPLSPRGAHELKLSDQASRSVCFVAICRTFGIPARLEPGSNMPQYFQNDKWNDVYLSNQKQPSQNKGYLRISSSDTKPVPEYYLHFTIARFANGRYNTLEYDENRKANDFKDELELAAGHYMIVTGNRLADSRILSNITFFDLKANEHKTINIKIRKEITENKVSGTIDLSNIVSLFNSKNCTPDRITNKGVAIFWIEPDKEPTKHIFNDLPLLKQELDSWGGYFLFLVPSAADNKTFRPELLTGLPANTLFGSDNEMTELKKISKTGLPGADSFPYVIVADKKGNILYSSGGYKIGIGEQILKSIKYE